MEFVPTIEDDTVVYFLIQNVVSLPVILKSENPNIPRNIFKQENSFTQLLK